MAQDAEKVINQAIRDFDSMKEFLEACGIEIPYDTDTSVYPEKMGEALALAYVSAINEFPIKSVKSPDAEGNIIDIFSMDSGTYIFEGRFRPYPEATKYFSFSSGQLVAVRHGTKSTVAQVFYPPNNAIQYLNIWEDETLETGYDFERQDAKLVDMESIANKVSQITEGLGDAHYPSVNAVKEYVDNAVTVLNESVTETNRNISDLSESVNRDIESLENNSETMRNDIDNLSAQIGYAESELDSIIELQNSILEGGA